MQSTKLGVGMLLLTIALVGCYHSRFNGGTLIQNSPEDKTLCLAGLKVEASYPGKAAETGRILPGEEEFLEFLTPETAGLPITVEAWCYGADGKEVGYTKIAGSYRYGPILSMSVRPPLQNPSEPPEGCDTPTEQRGIEVCINVPFI